MTISNAIKKVEKNFAKVIKQDGGNYTATKNNKEISFRKNGHSEDITCIRVRSIKDLDDILTDYCAGVFYDNISQALKYI